MSIPRHAVLFLRFVALYGIALAQPIYDLVGRSPEFRVAHRSGRAEILLLCAALTLGLPAVYTVLVATGRARQPRRRNRQADGLARWSVIVPPSSFAPGPNRVEVFVVRETADGRIRLEV